MNRAAELAVVGVPCDRTAFSLVRAGPASKKALACTNSSCARAANPLTRWPRGCGSSSENRGSQMTSATAARPQQNWFSTLAAKHKHAGADVLIRPRLLPRLTTN